MKIVHLVNFSFFSCKCHQRIDGRSLALIAIQYCHYSVCFIYFKCTLVANNFVSNFKFFLLFCRIGFRSVDLFGGFVLKFLLWIRQLLFQHLQTFLSSCLTQLRNRFVEAKRLCQRIKHRFVVWITF